MATFLELARKVARESGTVTGNLPLSVTGQDGRLGKIVYWTADAWRQIQNRHNAWLWMRDEYQDTLSAGAAVYTAASFNLTRWAAWVADHESTTIYDQALGVVDERPLLFMPWGQYRRSYQRGLQQQNRPRHYSISPAGEICFGPTPDAAYVVRGEYRLAPQELVDNDDVPEMPARFHDLIAHLGLLLLAEHDEAGMHMVAAMRRYRELLNELQRDQLPRMHIAADSIA